jgi:hypothetical protein
MVPGTWYPGTWYLVPVPVPTSTQVPNHTSTSTSTSSSTRYYGTAGTVQYDIIIIRVHDD